MVAAVGRELRVGHGPVDPLVEGHLRVGGAGHVVILRDPFHRPVLEAELGVAGRIVIDRLLVVEHAVKCRDSRRGRRVAPGPTVGGA